MVAAEGSSLWQQRVITGWRSPPSPESVCQPTPTPPGKRPSRSASRTHSRRPKRSVPQASQSSPMGPPPHLPNRAVEPTGGWACSRGFCKEGTGDPRRLFHIHGKGSMTVARPTAFELRPARPQDNRSHVIGDTTARFLDASPDPSVEFIPAHNTSTQAFDPRVEILLARPHRPGLNGNRARRSPTSPRPPAASPSLLSPRSRCPAAGQSPRTKGKARLSAPAGCPGRRAACK